MAVEREQPIGERPEGKPEAPREVSESVRRAQETLARAARERAEAAAAERAEARAALQAAIVAKDMAEYRAAAVALQPHLAELSASERRALGAKSDAMSAGPAVMGSVAELTAVNVIAENVRRWKRDDQEPRESPPPSREEPPSVIGRFLRRGIGKR